VSESSAPYGVSSGPIANDGGSSEALAIATLALGGVWTAVSVLAEVPYAQIALDYAARQESDRLTVAVGGALGLGSFVLMVPLWIVTCLWLRAERRRLAGRRHFEHGTVGTFFSWIVPIVNFVWPFRVVREVHEAAVEPQRRVSLGAWWTLWVLALIVGRLGSSLFNRQDLGDPAAPILAASAIFVALLVTAYVLWFRIVRSTSSGTPL
jgi:heme/copper-type cytochrome/quinol oxidase subunit 2